MRRPKTKFKFPLPLIINCGNRSDRAIADIADKLCFCFFDVEVFGDTIYAAKPVNNYRYAEAWGIFDRYELKVT